uniref:Uncharacterized protein n=1 Tax=Parascaris univalens TaxID=6257 RepID=A0A915CHU3_PARUN
MKPYQYVYSSEVQGAKGSTIGVVKVGVKKRKELIWSKDNEDQICAEPVFIANPHGNAEDDGVLVCPIVTLHEKDKPLMVILNAATMHEICSMHSEHSTSARPPFYFRAHSARQLTASILTSDSFLYEPFRQT